MEMHIIIAICILRAFFNNGLRWRFINLYFYFIDAQGYDQLNFSWEK